MKMHDRFDDFTSFFNYTYASRHFEFLHNLRYKQIRYLKQREFTKKFKKK